MATTDELFARALQCHQAGHLQQAEPLYHQVLQADPGHADALHLLGVLAWQAGRPDLALDYHRQALAFRPHDAAVHFDLALAYRALGRRQEGMASYRQVLFLQPDNAAAHNNLGNALREEGRPDEALTHYRRALQIKADYAEAHNNQGNALRDLGRHEEAAASYRQALRCNPAYAGAHANLGVVLTDLRQLAEAAAHLEQALRLQPDAAGTHYNLATTLLDLGRPAEAAAHLEQALRLQPTYVEARNALGVALADLGRRDEALRCYDEALRLDPYHVETHWNRALFWLESGDLARGWPEFEWRLEFRRLGLKRDFPEPRWDGSDLAGRTILLHAEGGFGDALHFVRYAPLVARRGGRVVLECPPRLVPLLRSVAGVEQVVARGGPLPPFDVQSPLQSLPLLFGTTLPTIPAEVPYLHADPERLEHWRPVVAALPGFKVGIAWQGTHSLRSIPLADFAPLAAVPGVRLVCLQKGPGTEQLAAAAEGLRLIDWGEKLDEAGAFVDTAAIMQHLDLVITVDTAPAHLAGALGVRVWVALPIPSDFRWLMGREDNPWYPTLRLFRQQRRGDWQPVLARMADELRGLSAGKDS